MKARQEMERKYQEKTRELATVKVQIQKNAVTEMGRGVSRPGATMPHSSQSTLGIPGMHGAAAGGAPDARKSVRMSKRVSVRPPGAPGPNGAPGARMSMRPGARKSMHVANQLTSLVSEIGKIEMAVQAAHAARVQAEERLYEICVEKLVVDEVLKKMTQSMTFMEAFLRSVPDEKVVQARKEMVEMISVAVQECGLEMNVPTFPGGTGNGAAGAAAPAAASAVSRTSAVSHSRTNSAPSVIPPPPPKMAPQMKPPPTPPAKSLAATKDLGGSSASLLDQIRMGTSLKTIDLQKLKEEKAKSDRDRRNRKSMEALKSLTDTLRDAIFARADDLLGEDEDDEEDEEEEDWME